MRLTRGCRAGGGVACSSLEYGGIRAATKRTPAPHDRLLLPTSPPPPHLVLLVHLRSTRLSRSHLLLYSPPGTSARSCCSLLPLSRILHRRQQQRRRRRCSHFSLKDITSSLCVWQRDRKDGQKKRGRSRK